MPDQGLSRAWRPSAATREDYVYPATSECWACGTVQLVTDRSTGLRRCSGTEELPHEEVTWKDELLPGATGDLARNIRAAERSLAEVRAKLGPRNDEGPAPHNVD